MGFPGGTIVMPPVTLGKPYSAEETLEHTQTLADGTHITQKPRTQKFYRDSQGRSRTERTMFAPPNARYDPPTLIEIRDPVEGYQYLLDTQNQIAHRQKLTVRTRPDGTAVQTIEARNIAPTAQTTHNAGVTRIQEPLGKQQMEGVNVEGFRMTVTFEAGTQGNDAPITETQEHWFSPDIGRDVLMKDSDPRRGETVNRLTNISVGDPDPALFQVPAGYQIVDETGQFQIKYTAKYVYPSAAGTKP
jgi:hypothetical protein